jgi:hypothetical protein
MLAIYSAEKRKELGNIETAKHDALNQIIDMYHERRCCLELLRFFGTYPYTRFNRPAVIHAMKETSSQLEVDGALRDLILTRIVQESFENNTLLYSLTGDEIIHGWIEEIAKLEWRHWQLVLNKAASRCGKTASSS